MSNEITTPVPPPKEKWRWGRFEPTGELVPAMKRMIKNTVTEEASREALIGTLVRKDEEE